MKYFPHCNTPANICTAVERTKLGNLEEQFDVLGGLKVCKSKRKKGKNSSLMQAEWMCLKIHVLLSHGGVFDFKPVFS